MFWVGLSRRFDSNVGLIFMESYMNIQYVHDPKFVNITLLENDTCIGVKTLGKPNLKHEYIRKTTK